MSNLRKFALLGSCLLAVHCGRKRNDLNPPPVAKETDTGAAPITLTGMTPETASIQTELVDIHCLSCHNADDRAGGINLSNLAELSSSKNELIVPANPDNSEFYTVMADGHMPPDGPPMSEESLAIVREWIQGLTPIAAKPDPRPTPPNPPTNPPGGNRPPTEAQPPVKATLESIQEWVNRNCVSCHDEATRENRQLDLRDIGKSIMMAADEPTTGFGRKVIIPAKPLKSLFYTIMDKEYTRDPTKLMPKDEEPVSSDVLATIKTWIEGLPPLSEQNPCEADPNRPECDEPVAP